MTKNDGVDMFIVFPFLNQKEVIPHISKDQYQTDFNISGYFSLELLEPTLEKTKTMGSSAQFHKEKKIEGRGKLDSGLVPVLELLI